MLQSLRNSSVKPVDAAVQQGKHEGVQGKNSRRDEKEDLSRLVHSEKCHIYNSAKRREGRGEEELDEEKEVKLEAGCICQQRERTLPRKGWR